DRLVGIFSERDVLRGFHNCGERFRTMRVAEVMTREPVTCNLDDDVNDVMGQMSERRIAKVPVLSESKLVGIVSVGDVIRSCTIRCIPRISTSCRTSTARCDSNEAAPSSFVERAARASTTTGTTTSACGPTGVP